MKEKCPVCKSNETEILRDFHNTSEVYSEMKLIHCLYCDMAFAAPMPSEKAIEEYNSTYFNSAHGDASVSTAANAFFSGLARLRVRHVENYLKCKSIDAKHVLEIGPGKGYFAKNWAENNSTTEYTVIETDSTCYTDLNKLGVQIINTSDIEKLKEVDLVIISHVLEHVTDPYEFLTKVTSRLRKGGVLFVDIPCNDWMHKPNDEPHLLFFKKKPLLHLLQEMGFEAIQASYHGQKIKDLQNPSRLHSMYIRLRSKLISWGIVKPFSLVQKGMESLNDPLERAVISPYKAHCESSTPAWWLRAVATKK
jgi:ubiquinone/menaquinone biosynthesis C-methylase UbiE